MQDLIMYKKNKYKLLDINEIIIIFNHNSYFFLFGQLAQWLYSQTFEVCEIQNSNFDPRI